MSVSSALPRRLVRRARSCFAWAISAAIAMPAGVSLAASGDTEINAAAAAQGGITAGDSPGFPVTISEPGNYSLSGNLITVDPNQRLIEIAADNVRLDLRGFLVGCWEGDFACGAGSGDGIAVAGPVNSFEQTHVRDGTVAGMGDYGMILGPRSSVTEVRVFENGDGGMLLGSHSRVVRSIARENGGDGIRILGSGAVSESISDENGGNGFDLGSDAVLSRSTALENGESGIIVGARSTVSTCYAYNNDGDGIRTGPSGTIRHNALRLNSGDGVDAGAGSLVQGNALGANGGFALNLDAEAAYQENHIAHDNGSTVNASPLNLGNNVCDGDLSCP